MRGLLLAAILAVAAMLASPSPRGDDFDSDLPVKDSETIRKTFDLSVGSTQKALDLDNVTGSIEVVGIDSTQVQLVLTRATRAKSQEKLEKARREVTLEITEQPGALRLYVNGPFRCRCDGHSSIFSREDTGYEVKMDFQLQVPRNTDLTLRTVNRGHISVRDVKGQFSVNNVNGGIEMVRLAGSGTAHTVNGPVKITFTENPRTESSFKSINGDIELYFVRGLSADFRFRTFNGAIYSDFPVASLPLRPVKQEREGGKTVFRADRYTGGRIGSGGTEIKAENLNGSIRILESHE